MGSSQFKKKLLDTINTVPCPSCGALAGMPCHLVGGPEDELVTNPHQRRVKASRPARAAVANSPPKYFTAHEIIKMFHRV